MQEEQQTTINTPVATGQEVAPALQEENQVAALPPRTTVQVFLADLAQKLGEDPASIQVQRHTTRMLERMQEGAIVTLRISRPRFQQKITLEMLGFQDEAFHALTQGSLDILTHYFRLGRRSLLPKEYQDLFQRIENNARYNLNKYATKTAWGYFVPTSLYPEWKADHLKQAEAFWLLVEQLRSNYDTVKEQLLEEYRVLAEELWARLTVGHTLSENTIVVEDEEKKKHQTLYLDNKKLWASVAEQLHASEGRAAFVKTYLEAIRQALPELEELADEKTWVFETEITAIPLPSTLAQDMVQADQSLAQHAIKDAKSRAEMEKVEAQRQIERIRLEREQILLAEERWRSQQKLTMEEREAERILNERVRHEQQRLNAKLMVERDVLNSARNDKMRLVNDFYRDVTARLNNLLRESLDQILTSLDKNEGILRGPTSTHLTELIERLRVLNFVEDELIETQLQRIREVLPKAEEQEAAKRGVARIDTRPIERVVRAVKAETEAVLIELGTTTVQRTKRQGAMPLDETGLIDLGVRRARPGSGLKTAAAKSQRRRVREPKP